MDFWHMLSNEVPREFMGNSGPEKEVYSMLPITSLGTSLDSICQKFMVPRCFCCVVFEAAAEVKSNILEKGINSMEKKMLQIFFSITKAQKKSKMLPNIMKIIIVFCVFALKLHFRFFEKEAKIYQMLSKICSKMGLGSTFFLGASRNGSAPTRVELLCKDALGCVGLL